MDVTSFILGFKKGAASGTGGGSVDGVHTVTFMSEDGSAVLYERLVVDGDDCANVVDRGLLATPTKESTAQYEYTYSGWSLTKGGSADASALKSVTADRTVYAAFTSAVRYYTITYYDGDTVLKTESLPYGAMPSYTPEKDGASFDGWSPALDTVTGDATYSAQWQTQITFAGGSWADIARISESGEAANYFALGEIKQITFTDKSGTEWTVNVVINGFNHDDLADGSGKAGISVTTEIVTFKEYFGSFDGNWGNSIVRTTLNDTVFNSLPTELKSVIKSVNKVYGYYDTTTSSATQGTSNDKIWIPSCGELGVAASASYSYAVGDGAKYAKFDQRKRDKDGALASYMLRTGLTTSNSKSLVYYHNSYSALRTTNPTGSMGVVFGFCI